MNHSLKKLYEDHHKNARGEGFSIMKEDRGEFLKNVIGTGKSILDIGCRDGALTQFFAESNTVVGADIDEHALAKAKEKLGIETVYMDLTANWDNFKGKKFDVIVAGELLEHVYYPAKVIEKAAAHLNEGGIFVGSVPNAFSLKNRIRFAFGTKKNTPLSDPTHINHFHAEELHVMLKKYFTEVNVSGLGKWKKLAKLSPNFFSFDLVFVAKK